MRKENRFLALFIIFILLAALISVVVLSDNREGLPAFLYGFGLSTFNFAAGLIPLKYALKRENKGFLSFIYGGILVRLLLLLVMVYAGLELLEIKRDVFIFVIFIFYSFYLFAEIFYFYLLKGKTD